MENYRNPTTRDIGFNGSSAVVYEDNQGEMGIVRLGASAPTWRTYDHGVGGGIAFEILGFTVNNYIEFNVQSFHEMQLNSILESHIHFILPNTTTVGDKFKFQLDVIASSFSSAFAVPAGSPYTAEHTIVAGDNTTQRYLELAKIPAVNTTVSTIYKCRLTRIAASADEYASEVYLEYVDCHYALDTVGSLTEGVK